MAEKDSFVLYNSYYDLLEDLDMEQRGTLLTAILEHSRGMDQTELDPITKLAYRVIASQLDRDRKKWERTCKKRAEAGRRGGLAKASKAKQSLANLAKAGKAKQSLANLAEYEYESEYESESESENEYEDDYEYVDESESESTGRDDSTDSIREGFRKAFGRAPDKPFTAGIKKKLTQVSKRDVLDVIEIARGKHPGNPEAYIMAALSDRGQRSRPQKPEPGADDPDRPLEQWEQDWLAEVQRRRAQRGAEQDN